MKILITGATSGIGKSLAIKYAQLGHRVFGIGRSLDGLRELSEYNVIPISADVTDLNSVAQAGEQISNQSPSLDLVILNAGTCEYIDATQFTSQTFKDVMNVNFFGITNCLECFLPLLRKANNPHLVGVASMAYYLPLSRAEAYGASKAAVNYLFEALAIDLAELNIDVTVINPGFVKTPLTGRNDFEMPFLVDVDDATTIIMTGITQRVAEISFPSKLTLPMKILSLLPRTLWRTVGKIFRK
ncbi:MAG: SDR family NAD(P)-dependent oxidoreductase [Proteobacteria bacterium]|nr:MAG: SDR family NAD(P)-dependent oxidoreductase [Pseudomonadota bacterium]